MSTITVRISKENFFQIRGVDAKRIALEQLKNAKVITHASTSIKMNSFRASPFVVSMSLQTHGNRFLPGEAMRVFVLGDGKEYNQVVAYRDERTMAAVKRTDTYWKDHCGNGDQCAPDHRRNDDMRTCTRG
jgi:uncharacterized protein YacL